MRQNGVSELRIWQPGQHRRLHCRRDLARLGADHGEAEDAIITSGDQRLHEAGSVADRLHPQYLAHRQLRHTRSHALATSVPLAQSNVGQRRVREDAVGDQPIACGAVAAGEILFDDPEVVDGCVRELRATSALSDGPDVGCRRLQPLGDAHVATIVQLDAGLLETDPGGVRRAPHRDEDVAALDPLLPGRGAHCERHVLSGSAVHAERLSRHETFDAFVAENPLHLVRNVAILLAEKLWPMLDDRHAAAEATVRLAEFETDITTAEHDQMWRHVVELQRFDIGKRARGLKAWNIRDRRVCPEVEEDLVGRQYARAAVIEAHLERFRSHEAPGPHDQLSAAVLVVAPVPGDLAVDHVTLALANPHHVNRHAAGRRAELRGVLRHMRDVRAPDLVLAGHAVDVGTGAADPLALHDGSPSPRSRQMPGEQLAARATAEDERFEPFRMSHACLQVQKMLRTPSTDAPALAMNIDRRLRSKSRARWARVFAVGTVIPRTSATSAIDNPSTSYSTITAR